MSIDDDTTKKTPQDEASPQNKWEKILQETDTDEEQPTDKLLNDIDDQVPTVPVEQTVDELTASLAAKTAEAAQYKESWMRSVADRKNLEVRLTREIDKARKYGTEKLITEFVQILDSIGQGIEAANQQNAEPTQQTTAIIEGMQLTEKMMLDTLAKHGVKPLDPLGEKYDPHYHEAIAMQPDPDAEANTVITVIQKGYQLHDRIIRPARVIVAKG